MRKITYCFQLTLLFLLCLTGSATASDLQQSLNNARERIAKMGEPYYKITAISKLPVNNPALGKTPFTAYRFILSGKPLKALLKEDATSFRRLDIPEMADIILIPADVPFRLDKALALSTPTTQEETRDLFYEQFGFLWRKLDSNLTRYTLYVGKNKDFYCFAASNLSLLLRLQVTFAFEGGFSPVEYLTEALSTSDIADTTASTALHQLTIFGNEALPYMKQEIEKAIEQNDSPSLYFQVLAKIGTPEAFTMLSSFADDTLDMDVLQPLFDTVIANKLKTEHLLPCYRTMLRKQYGIEFAGSAMEKCGKAAELKAAFQEIVEQPENYSNFRFALMALETWSNPSVIPKHKDAQEQVMILLLRGGDLPGSTVFQTVSEKESAAAREYRLSQEDQERIKPVVDYLLNAPEYRLSILMALDLTLLDDAGLPKPTRKYAARVRDTGRKILLAMPSHRKEIEHYIRTLLTHTKNQREQQLFGELAKKMNIPVPTRAY